MQTMNEIGVEIDFQIQCAIIVLAYSYASRPLKHDVEGVLLVYYILLCQSEESREYAAIISNIHATMCAKDCHCCTLSPYIFMP